MMATVEMVEMVETEAAKEEMVGTVGTEPPNAPVLAETQAHIEANALSVTAPSQMSPGGSRRPQPT